MNPQHYDFIEIGCSDFDTLIQTCNSNTKGISVEPLSCYLNHLPTQPNVTKVQSAISNRDGQIDIWFIDPQVIAINNLPLWLKGCNSVNEPHYQSTQGFSEFYKKESVTVLSVETFISKYCVASVDYLKIDTEGHDCVILNAWLDAIEQQKTMRPLKILFETNILSNVQDQQKLLMRLQSFGYETISHDTDTLVVLKNPCMNHPVTNVTMLFNVPQEKHSGADYKKWSLTLLEASNTPLIIFTDAANVDAICTARKLIKMNVADTFDVSTGCIVARNRNTIVVELQLHMLPLYTKYWSFFEWCHSIDQEKHIHSPQVYLLWNSKLALLRWALDHPLLRNAFGSSWFTWTDIGCCREGPMNLNLFPNSDKFEQQLIKDKIMLHSIEDIVAMDYQINTCGIPTIMANISDIESCTPVIKIQAGFMVLHRDFLNTIVQVYLDTLDRFVSTKTFAGKEQNVLTAMSILHPTQVHVLPAKSTAQIKDKWFAFLERWS